MHERIHKFYESADLVRTDSTGDRERILSLVDLLEDGPIASFLDIGCYDGSKTVLLANFVQAERIYGVDFLPTRLAQAQARGIEIKAVDLNADPLPFADAEFDFVFCGDVIEHLFSPDRLLEEVARILRPDGYALLTTPNLASWRNRLVLLFGWQPFGTEVSTRTRVGNPRVVQAVPSGHIRVFVPRALRELSEMCGFWVEYLGGLVVDGSSGDWIEIASRTVDKIIARFCPTLCDELVIKLRKV